jgi:hypothetical protein
MLKVLNETQPCSQETIMNIRAKITGNMQMYDHE